MIGETIRRLAVELDTRIGGTAIGESCFLGRHYKTHPFDRKNFHQIRHAKNTRKVAFVDGGNQEILGTPNISIQLNRVYFNVFDGPKRAAVKCLPQSLEFISVTVADFLDHSPHYRTQIFPVTAEFSRYLPDSSDLEFSAKDESLTRNHPLDISRVASMARRFAEWSYSRHVVNEELFEGDILVMDGSLKTRFSKEPKYSKDCYSASKSKGVIYTGLAKSSRLVTTSGMSLLGAVRTMASENRIDGIWYYHPIAESLTANHAADMFVVKLHERSQRVYRYDIHNEQAKNMSHDEIMQVFTQLSVNSSDLSFLGYPYGLIDADDNARVRDEEREAYRVMVLSEISRLGSWPKFVREMQAADAHDMLNFLKGGVL